MSLRLRARAGLQRGLRDLAGRAGYDIVGRTGSHDLAVRHLLQGIDLVVDGGANVGQYAQSLRQAGYTGQIVSVEPGAEAFAVLSSFASRDPKWTALSSALGPEAGTATLHLSDNSVSSSLLRVGAQHVEAAPRSATTSEQSVPVTTLDALGRDFAAAEHVWLKLDLQGYELPALRGGSEVLSRTDVLQVELSVTELYEGQSTYWEVLGFLRGKGFELLQVKPGFADAQTGRLYQFDALMGSEALRSRL